MFKILKIFCQSHRLSQPYLIFDTRYLGIKGAFSFLNFAKKNKLSFLALEYSGHGKSSGKFIKGNITKWSNETSILIRKVIKKNNFVIVGF